MTLQDASRELRKISGQAYVSVHAEVTIGRTGFETTEVKWYANTAPGYSESFPSLEECLADARRYYGKYPPLPVPEIEVEEGQARDL